MGRIFLLVILFIYKEEPSCEGRLFFIYKKLNIHKIAFYRMQFCYLIVDQDKQNIPRILSDTSQLLQYNPE